MLIGEVARRTGVPAGTIRFYERHALVSPAERSPAGYRLYSDRTVNEIRFIKKAQRLGFSLDEIREILSLGASGRMPCDRVVSLCEAHLEDIERRIEELERFKRQLRDTLREAKSGCGFTADGFCRAIDG